MSIVFSLQNGSKAEWHCDKIIAPKDVHILSPRTFDYVTLHGKRDFAIVIH